MLNAQERSVKFDKVVFETEFGPVEVPLKTELSFRGDQFVSGVALNNPRITWEVVPKLEASNDTPNGKYFLMIEVLNCPVKFIGSSGEYEDRVIFMATFIENSIDEIGSTPKTLKNAAENKKHIIIRAKLAIEGFYRLLGENTQALIHQGNIEISNVRLK